MAGVARNAENEDLLATHATVLVKKQTFLDQEATVATLKKQQAEFSSAWEFKIKKDQHTFKQKMQKSEEGFKQNLLIHQEGQRTDIARRVFRSERE